VRRRTNHRRKGLVRRGNDRRDGRCHERHGRGTCADSGRGSGGQKLGRRWLAEAEACGERTEAARVTLHNLCIWLNEQLGRPRLAFADLLGW